MSWAVTGNNQTIELASIPVKTPAELCTEIIEQCRRGARPVAFFGHKLSSGVRLFVILANDPRSELMASSATFAEGEKSYPSITGEIPAFHLFEREFYEETGIRPEGHPWLKPVRFSHNRADRSAKMADYPFFKVEGESVHEVGVGPVHAGVIEPGHFRFMCSGEKVHHLEIHLGYQHRGIEPAMADGSIWKKSKLVESIAGDSAIANSLAYSSLLESAAGIEVSARATAIRTLALELERVALHMSSMSGLCGDVGDLTGNTFFGATRTYVINSLLDICGSRFGYSLIRPGGVNFNIDAELSAKLLKTLEMVRERVFLIGERTFNMPGVLSRFQHTGIVDGKTAEQINMVGITARASGLKRDIRADHPFGFYRLYPAYKLTLDSGDVFARAYMRYLEAKRSLGYMIDLLSGLPPGGQLLAERGSLKPDSMTVSMVEGPRGELVHVMITGANGEAVRYKFKDPSFNNWFGLALAVRGEGVSDFPICNKSFDLSYCGYDL